jgi:hypothetical protein
VPVLSHEDAIARFRTLRRADADYRAALHAVPRTAELLVAYWRERRASGLTTGLMLESFGVLRWLGRQAVGEGSGALRASRRSV